MSTVRVNHKVELQKFAPRHKVEYKGLCSRCSLASECTFPRDPERPIQNCDEFDGLSETVDGMHRIFENAPTEPRENVSAEPEKATPVKGLCVNCVKREECTFPKPETGVWHCDEYE